MSAEMSSRTGGRRDDVAGAKSFGNTVAAPRLHGPKFPFGIIHELLAAAVHDNAPAKPFDFSGRCFPHHARTAPWVTEGLDQGFGFVIQAALYSQGALQAIGQRLE